MCVRWYSAGAHQYLQVKDSVVRGVAAEAGDDPVPVPGRGRVCGGAGGRTATSRGPRPGRGRFREERLHECVELGDELQGGFLAVRSLGEVSLKFCLELFLHSLYLLRAECILLVFLLLAVKAVLLPAAVNGAAFF